MAVLFWALNEHPVTASNLLLYTVQVSLAVVILVLNGLVLDTMVRQGKSREPADLLVASLALTDALTGVFLVYNTIYSLVYYQVMAECLFRFGLGCAILSVSDLHLLCLTTDRYVKILTPYRYTSFCGKWTVGLALLTSWLLGTVIGLLPSFGWNQATASLASGEPVCTFFGIMHPDFLRFYMVVINVPVAVMAGLYVRLYFVSRKHVAAIRAQSHARRPPGSDHAWRYAKTVLLMVGVYFVCWLPLGTLVCLVVTGQLDDVSNARKGDYLLMCSSVVFVNSIINPVIYAFKLPAIRRRFLHTCCCLRRCLGKGVAGQEAGEMSVISVP